MPVSGAAPILRMPVNSRSVDGAIQRIFVNLSTFAGWSGRIARTCRVRRIGGMASDHDVVAVNLVRDLGSTVSALPKMPSCK